MTPNTSIIPINHRLAGGEAAIDEEEEYDFDVDARWTHGRGLRTDKHLTGYYAVCDRMKVWGKTAVICGAVGGLFFGSTLLSWIPGLGPLPAAGSSVRWVVGALGGAIVVGGLSLLAACWSSVEVPKGGLLRQKRTLETAKFTPISLDSMRGITRANEMLGHAKQETSEHSQ